MFRAIELVVYLRSWLFTKLYSIRVHSKGLVYIYLDSNDLFQLVKFFFFSCIVRGLSLVDIWAIDYPARRKGLGSFCLKYNVLSIYHNVRIILNVNISKKTMLFSLVELYKSSNWLEREVWDMFGIFFLGNKDLRRILTDYGFRGHPLLKKFPLMGYLEVFFDEIQKALIFEAVELTQEFRFFNFINFCRFFYIQ